MDPLVVNPITAITQGSLSALRPVQALVVPATQNPSKSASLDLSAQNLAQTFFQRTQQAASLFPLVEPVTARMNLLPVFTDTLMTSLNAPQSADATQPSLEAVPNLARTEASSSATVPTPSTTLPGDLSATQDTFASSSSIEFALQTALRFGAGVGTMATGVLSVSDLTTDLVRDASPVPRLDGLQSHTGGPGPEAFAPPSAATQRVLRDYQPGAATGVALGLDLLV